jgi:hypothetical protein
MLVRLVALLPRGTALSDPDPLDAPRIGIEDVKDVARRVPHLLAHVRYAVRHGDDEAAERVDLVALIFGQELAAELLLEVVEIDPGVGLEPAIRAMDQLSGLLDPVLVMDFAQELDHEVLDCGEPVRAAEFVDHGDHVGMALAHLQKQVEHAHRRRHHRHRAHDLGQRENARRPPRKAADP